MKWKPKIKIKLLNKNKTHNKNVIPIVEFRKKFLSVVFDQLFILLQK